MDRKEVGLKYGNLYSMFNKQRQQNSKSYITQNLNKDLVNRFFTSYGIRSTLFSILDPLIVTKFQLVNKEMYDSGVAKIQTKIRFQPKKIYFSNQIGGNAFLELEYPSFRSTKIFWHNKEKEFNSFYSGWLSLQISDHRVF